MVTCCQWSLILEATATRTAATTTPLSHTSKSGVGDRGSTQSRMDATLVAARHRGVKCGSGFVSSAPSHRESGLVTPC